MRSGKMGAKPEKSSIYDAHRVCIAPMMDWIQQ